MDENFCSQLEKIRVIIGKDGKDSDLLAYDFMFHERDPDLIRVITKKGNFEYHMKSLAELYAPVDAKGIEKNEDNPLMYIIELAIKRVYDNNPNLTEPKVILVLEQMAAKPEQPATDELTCEILNMLRIQLSLCDFSRGDVRRAINKIIRSVKRHYEIDGLRGYLDFIVEFFP
ncbi:MAG: hypothetical protein QME52_08705 [Bacteroidota bacterium]|nr:hypothetical protein [Bacteroidota bacterium]